MRSERIEAHLRSAGFHDARTSADYFRQLPDSADIWMRAAQTSADPDLVALQLVRLHEADRMLCATYSTTVRRASLPP